MNFDQAVSALKDFESNDLYTFGVRHEKAILEQVMIIGSAGAKDIAKDLLTNDFESYPDSFYMVAMLQSDADLQVWIDGYGKRKVISFAKAWVQAFREVKRTEDLKAKEVSEELPQLPLAPSQSFSIETGRTYDAGEYKEGLKSVNSLNSNVSVKVETECHTTTMECESLEHAKSILLDAVVFAEEFGYKLESCSKGESVYATKGKAFCRHTIITK
ncbi:TPA: hypothetical protein ACRZ4F_001572 [Vibrio harveyi]